VTQHLGLLLKTAYPDNGGYTQLLQSKPIPLLAACSFSKRNFAPAQAAPWHGIVANGLRCSMTGPRVTR
jgi:hypothetical protein